MPTNPSASQLLAASGAAFAARGADRGPQPVQRPQPVEKIHVSLFTARDQRPGLRPADDAEDRAPRPARTRAGPMRGYDPTREVSFGATAPLSGLGPSIPFLAHLIAHEAGALSRPHMPKDLRGFSDHAPVEAYQAVINRERLIVVDAEPAEVAA